ncbi:hypothetical protein [Sulfitobacter sp. F26204]|nr:hypothetical protein [Sulfitobacter sp. F26204]
MAHQRSNCGIDRQNTKSALTFKSNAPLFTGITKIGLGYMIWSF